ncbi:hypothetical protein [Streptomyces sp. NPDC102476]|uniref:hypothetical protein n=1 Tax=Streptomyces sp. NPDC102476 TaxID=3366181 RepID=UPI0038111A00
MSTAPAQAGQHQDANEYALWAFHGANGFWNIDQRVQITRKAHHSCWAMLWDFTATPGKGGYMGLQTNGTRFNLSEVSVCRAVSGCWAHRPTSA